jgi:hypothetical protein
LGYHFTKPLPAHRLKAWIAQQHDTSAEQLADSVPTHNQCPTTSGNCDAPHSPIREQLIDAIRDVHGACAMLQCRSFKPVTKCFGVAPPTFRSPKSPGGRSPT